MRQGPARDEMMGKMRELIGFLSFLTGSRLLLIFAALTLTKEA
jgi:hypothetical protein